MTRPGPGSGARVAPRRAVLRWLGAGLAAAVAGPPAVQAQATRWPARPVRLLVAYPAGGVSDSMARELARFLSAQWSVGVIVENRPGAGGAVALRTLIGAQPDGHTLVLAAATAVRLATPAADTIDCAERPLDEPNAQGRTPAPEALPVTPVAGLMRTPVLIAGTPALAAARFEDLVRLARARPGTLRWATTGEGTTGHKVMEQVGHASGLTVVHVPYKGGGQQIADALGGHFEVLSTNVAEPQLRAIAAGQLSALAVGASARLTALPDTPTLGELGLPQANLDSLFGLFGPPRTPAAIVRRIHADVARALLAPPLRERLAAMSNTPFSGSTEAFAAEIQLRSRREVTPTRRC